jgi:hypothetical protein
MVTPLAMVVVLMLQVPMPFTPCWPREAGPVKVTVIVTPFSTKVAVPLTRPVTSMVALCDVKPLELGNDTLITPLLITPVKLVGLTGVTVLVP